MLKPLKWPPFLLGVLNVSPRRASLPRQVRRGLRKVHQRTCDLAGSRCAISVRATSCETL